VFQKDPELIKKLADRDVRCVLHEAETFVVLEKNQKIRRFDNKRPRLGVLAVVGPGMTPRGIPLNEAVLLEVGYRKTRPYQPARKPYRRVDEPHEIPPRKKWCALNEEQYQKVGPWLFEELQFRVDELTSEWKGTTYPVPTRQTYWTNRGGKMTVDTTWKKGGKRLVYWPRGLRFSASKHDELLLRDLYWAEMEGNSHIKQWLRGLARFLDKRLKPYRGKSRTYMAHWQGLKDVRHVLEASSLPHYLKIEMLRYLPHQKNGQQNWFYDVLCDILEWNGTPTRERQLASLALPGVKRRIKDTQLRIKKAVNGHVVFEIFPTGAEVGERTYVSPQEQLEREAECFDVPF
jgi:hypothetical protein